jgi:hypothetical protein
MQIAPAAKGLVSARIVISNYFLPRGGIIIMRGKPVRQHVIVAGSRQSSTLGVPLAINASTVKSINGLRGIANSITLESASRSLTQTIKRDYFAI